MHPNDTPGWKSCGAYTKGTLAGQAAALQMEFDQNDTVISVYLGLALACSTGAA